MFDKEQFPTIQKMNLVGSSSPRQSIRENNVGGTRYTETIVDQITSPSAGENSGIGNKEHQA